MKLYQLFFYVPEPSLETVKDAIFAVGGGRIGNYECCAWHALGEGQFRALPGANPAVGSVGEMEVLPEYRVELVCTESTLTASVDALKKSHPYETPAYGVVELKNI